MGEIADAASSSVPHEKKRSRYLGPKQRKKKERLFKEGGGGEEKEINSLGREKLNSTVYKDSRRSGKERIPKK